MLSPLLDEDLASPATGAALDGVAPNPMGSAAEMVDGAIATELRIGLADTHIDSILAHSQEVKASDIHLSSGLPPMVRIDGRMQALDYIPTTPREIQRLVYDILTSEQIAKFERT